MKLRIAFFLFFFFIYANLPIFHFGSVIQNLAVVSCRLSVSSVCKALASLLIRLVRWDPTPCRVPNTGFDPRTSASRVWRSIDWANWRLRTALFTLSISNILFVVHETTRRWGGLGWKGKTQYTAFIIQTDQAALFILLYLCCAQLCFCY